MDGVKPAMFKVTSTLDLPDAKPGNGFCSTAAGTCTLRAAIQEVNASGNNLQPATIYLRAHTYKLMIGGYGENAAATGDLDVAVSVNVVGRGAGKTIIDGNGLDRVFHVTPHYYNPDTWDAPLLSAPGEVTQLTLSALTIRNGKTPADGLSPSTVWSWSAGGGIFNTQGRVVLFTSEGDPLGLGAVYLFDTRVINNFAALSGGGIQNEAGLVAVVGGEISNNQAGHEGDEGWSWGGGVENDKGTTLIDRCLIAGNQAFKGGGIFNWLGYMRIGNSTLIFNRAEGCAAVSSVSWWGPTDRSGFTLLFSTVVQNEVAPWYYDKLPQMCFPSPIGGLCSEYSSGCDIPPFTIGASIVAQNFAVVESPPGWLPPSGVSNCGDELGALAGQFRSVGYNIVDVVDPLFGELVSDPSVPSAVDFLGIDPGLDVFGYNGGPTKTYQLNITSPAIDQVPLELCEEAGFVDQRGFPRPVDGNADGTALCDIGAVEYTP
ncbi:MAG: hypothetical protein HYV03_07660 [Deltaproteobacteria bacterium]|nr:hypothetical protein [Deltaproteobacteria bacterium]